MALHATNAEHAASFVFGRNPITRSATLRLPESITGSPDDEVQFIVRALTHKDMAEVFAAVGKCSTLEDKQIAWIQEPLIRSLISIGGVEMPTLIEERRKLIEGWPDVIVAVIYECYNALDSEMRAACEFVGNSPKVYGANGGSSVAPQGNGTEENSTPSQTSG